MTDASRPTAPAATLILWRDGPPAKVLMVERAATMAFAAGAMVFPGGRVDPGDHVLAAEHGGDPDETAARIAAIRETVEEVGLAVAIEPAPDPATLARWRTALADGVGFGALLAARGHRLLLDRLLPFARWRPNLPETRVFDTRFFLVRVPEAAQPLADGGETVHALWAAPQAILDDAAAGRHRVIFPTARNLERLAALPDYRAAQAHLATHPVRLVTPWIERRGDIDWLCIPDDLGYPVTAQPLRSAHRG